MGQSVTQGCSVHCGFLMCLPCTKSRAVWLWPFSSQSLVCGEHKSGTRETNQIEWNGGEGHFQGTGRVPGWQEGARDNESSGRKQHTWDQIVLCILYAIHFSLNHLMYRELYLIFCYLGSAGNSLSVTVYKVGILPTWCVAIKGAAYQFRYFCVQQKLPPKLSQLSENFPACGRGRYQCSTFAGEPYCQGLKLYFAMYSGSSALPDLLYVCLWHNRVSIRLHTSCSTSSLMGPM